MELQNQKRKSASKIVGVVISIIVLVLAGTVGKQVATSLFKSSTDDTVENELIKLANELNKNCPFMVDSDTRLDNTAAIKKNLHYNYTFINYNIDEIDKDYLESNLRPIVLNGLKTHPDMKYLRDRRVTFIYNYRDKNGTHLISFKFTPQEYL